MVMFLNSSSNHYGFLSFLSCFIMHPGLQISWLLAAHQALAEEEETYVCNENSESFMGSVLISLPRTATISVVFLKDQK